MKNRIRRNTVSTIRVKGVTFRFDREDQNLISRFRWSLNRHPHTTYAQAAVPGARRVISMHRLVMGCTHLDGTHVHHIDGDGTNNTKSNLTVLTPKAHAQTTVRDEWIAGRQDFVKRSRTSRARVYITGTYLGSHDNEQVAVEAADMLAGLYFGAPPRLTDHSAEARALVIRAFARGYMSKLGTFTGCRAKSTHTLGQAA